MTLDPVAINAAAELIADADALLVGAGAGMGVDSGLPDFRGAEGFWRAYPALGQRGMKFTEVASPRTFEEDPALAWGFYGHRLALYRSTRPHAGFEILRRWGEQKFHGYGVFTSNVDGHFHRAGFDGARLAECHGSIHHLQCSKPCSEATWPADGFVPEIDVEACKLLNAPPACPWCGAMARPNILMFGDGGWSERRSIEQEQRLRRWLDGVGRLVVVELGAGTAIPSVRHFSHATLIDREAVLVRINPREPLTPRRQDVSIAAPALAALQAIDDVLSCQEPAPTGWNLFRKVGLSSRRRHPSWWATSLPASLPRWSRQTVNYPPYTRRPNWRQLDLPRPRCTHLDIRAVESDS